MAASTAVPLNAISRLLAITVLLSIEDSWWESLGKDHASEQVTYQPCERGVTSLRRRVKELSLPRSHRPTKGIPVSALTQNVSTHQALPQGSQKPWRLGA